MLRLRELSVSYGAVAAVRGLDLDVAAGEVVALVGANGAGKSSTLKCVAGVAPRSAGRILLDGEPVDRLPAHARPARGIALSPEGRHVFPAMSVEENLLLGAGDASRPVVASRLADVRALFPKLDERAAQAAGTLSGGEQQMVAIGRALMSGPRVLLLDEPTLGLAPVVVRQIAQAIRALRDRGLAVLLSEQNVEMALAASDRAYVLETGRVVREGPSAALAGDPAIQTAYLGL